MPSWSLIREFLIYHRHILSFPWCDVRVLRPKHPAVAGVRRDAERSPRHHSSWLRWGRSYFHSDHHQVQVFTHKSIIKVKISTRQNTNFGDQTCRARVQICPNLDLSQSILGAQDFDRPSVSHALIQVLKLMISGSRSLKASPCREVGWYDKIYYDILWHLAAVAIHY